MKDERPSEPREKTDELLDAAKRRGRGLLDRQKTAAGDELHSVADVMRDASRRLEERQEESLAGYATKAADGIDRLSAALREREPAELLSEAERMFRSRPVLGMAATACAGYFLGRLLKAGSKSLARKGDEAPAPPQIEPAPLIEPSPMGEPPSDVGGCAS